MLAMVIRFLVRHLVTALMVAVGLRASRADLRSTWQQRGLLLRALLVLELGVPLLGLLTAIVLPLRPEVATTIALMAACPGAPLVLRVVRGRAVVVVILAAVSLLAPLTLPAWVWVLDQLLPVELAVRIWPIVRIALTQVVLPLVVGLAAAALAPRMAEPLGKVFWWLFLALLGLAAVAVTARGAPLLVHAKAVALAALALVVIGALAMGHWAGGPRLADRGALAQTAVLGNPALALAVVSYSFPGREMVTLMAAYLLARALALLPYQLLARRWFR